MFWKYNHQSSPHIDTLLNKEDVTLQELMDEEDVLQECKVQNKKLIDFLVRPEIMEELVRLTTVEPTGDMDEKQRYKYPNIACEILTCDVPTLNERLAGDEELLGKLYTFLEMESPLNPLLASFFSKTLGVLVARKSEQNWYSYQFTCLQVLEFLKSKENFLTLLLKHLGTSAIMDLLLKLITQIEGAEMKQSILNWLDSQQVIQCLVGLLDPAVEGERNCNASQLLCDVIKTARDNQHTSTEKGEPDPILSRVEDPEVVTQLLDRMFGAEKRESSIVGGVTVLLTLLDCSRPSHEATSDQVQFLASDQPHDETPSADGADHASKVALTTLEAILPRLKDFHGLLVDPPYKPSVRTTAGLLDPPLGNTRLHIAKLLATVIAANHSAINKELAALGTVETLLDLFFKYSWNNFLHSQVEQCLAFALNVEVVDGDGEGDTFGNNALLKNIFIQCRLLQRILEAWEENETQQSKEGGLRKGYMGHLIKIANCVMTQVEKGSLGTFIQENVPADTVAAWEAFVTGAMAETNKTHAISLGGVHPAHSSSEDDDADYSDIPFPQDIALQQAFADYQMQQIAPQFIENYGFHDEEFLDGDDMLHASVDRLTSMTFSLSEADLDKQAEIFKKVCEQKLRSGGNSEDEVWDDDQDSSFPTIHNTRTSADWQSALDGEAANSSDEDEREGPEGREEIRMEVDTTDPWASGEAASESMVAGIAVDAANPWATPVTTTTANPPGTDQGGWADFGSGGFADFEANFDSPPDDKKPAEMVVAEGTSSTIATTNDQPAVLPDVSPVQSDKNANPSTETVQDDQLNDNHRFLGTPAVGIPAGAGDQSAVALEETAPTEPAEPPVIAIAPVPAAVVVAEQVPASPKSAQPEETPSAAAVPSPNGPI